MKNFQYQLLAFLATTTSVFSQKQRNATELQIAKEAQPNFWINGKRLGPSVKADQVYNYTADIIQYAQQYSASWSTPGDAGSEQTGYIVSFDGNSRLYFDYTLNLGNCQPIAPLVTWQAGALYCGTAGGCQESVAQTYTTTDQRDVGFKTTTSISGTLGFDVPLVAKAEVTATTGSEDDIDVTTSNTTSTTITQIYNLVPGETCNPTTISFQSTCSSTITINEFNWQYQNPRGSGYWQNVVDGVPLGNLCSEWDTNSEYWSATAQDYYTLNLYWNANFGKDTDDFVQTLCAQAAGQSPGSPGIFTQHNGFQFQLSGCALA